MIHAFHILRDIFAVIGVLWVVLTILFAIVESVRGRGGS